MNQFTKPTNPKDLIGSGKLPLHLWPETATMMGCMGLLDGMLKYGRGNYRALGVRASIYVDACKRHLNAWFEGEDLDPDSGLPHLAHALACLAIIVDAEAAGKLTDDRQYPGGYRDMVEKLTPHVGRLKALHEARDPKHYTIADREMPGTISSPGVHNETLTLDELEEMLRKRVTVPQPHDSWPIWQRPHHFPFGGGEVMSTLEVRRDAEGMINSVGCNFDDEEIEEMCRLAESGTVTLPLT